MAQVSTQQSLLHSTRVRGDKIMQGVCWLLWLVSLGFVYLHGTWMLWLWVGTGLSLTASGLYRLAPGTLGSRLGMAAIFMAYSALMIDQSHGVIETHFGIFALLSFLLYYRDWRPILCGAVVICVHHLGFMWLQMNGYPVFVMGQTQSMMMVWVHAAYVVFEAVVLIFLARIIEREGEESAAIANFGARIGDAEVIDLTFDSAAHTGVAARGFTHLLDAVDGVTRQSAAIAERIGGAAVAITLSSARMLELSGVQTQGATEVLDSVEGMRSATKTMKAKYVAVGEVAKSSVAIVAEGCLRMQQASELMLTLSDKTDKNVAEIVLLQTESQRIRTIVGIMNDVASQTNMLALNASIEAARAGENGRGFEVVAYEIRVLSERTRESLEEVQSIMSEIGRRVGQLRKESHECRDAAVTGAAQVRAAREALTEVVEHLPEISSRVAEMMEAAEQHTLIGGKILAKMGQIGAAVEKSADSTAQLAALSTSLEEMSAELSVNVSRFQHGGSGVETKADESKRVGWVTLAGGTDRAG